MTRVRAALATAILMASIAAPMTGRAAHSVGCGGSWTTKKQCLFSPTRLPLQIFAESATSSGQASMNVRISHVTNAGEVVLLECAASGSRFATCGDEMGPDASMLAQVLPLTCLVSGRGSGTYFCGNPCPKPPPAPCV